MAQHTRALMQARSGAVSSPHYLASVAGLGVLQKGGNAVDAAIAINSTLGVVYPHMTGIGGDAFWLIYDSAGNKVHALNGTGRSAKDACRDFYGKAGHKRIPERGPLAAVTVPGAVDSWCKAHERFGRLGLDEILKPAITYARDGFPVSAGQAQFSMDRFDILSQTASTRNAYLPGGKPPEAGSVMRLPQLGETLQSIAAKGRAGFYEGPVADEIVRALGAEGSYWQKSDLHEHHGIWSDPITTTYRGLTACQHPPNSQGFVHLMLLNVLEQFDLSKIPDTSPDYTHLIVEACKHIFEDRDRYLTDPAHCDIPLDQLLSKEYAKEIAGRIRMNHVAEDLREPMGQDTTCTVVVDKDGNAVSIIQSIYHEFGSAFVAGESGVLLQNRGSSFALDDNHVNCLEGGKLCFHTLMPGMLLKDGRPYLVYGTMGGEGQPQTSTMIASRVVDYGLDVQTALDRPRWLYGRTWGEDTKSLRVETRFGAAALDDLRARGHTVEPVGEWSDLTGHAAAIRCDPDTGVLAAGADARGDGVALGW